MGLIWRILSLWETSVLLIANERHQRRLLAAILDHVVSARDIHAFLRLKSTQREFDSTRKGGPIRPHVPETRYLRSNGAMADELSCSILSSR